MPLYKYVANRFLTAAQNTAHAAQSSPSTTPATGPSRARCSSSSALGRELRRFRVRQPDAGADPSTSGFAIGEISCPTKYFEEASSINFQLMEDASSKYLVGHDFRRSESRSGRIAPASGCRTRSRENFPAMEARSRLAAERPVAGVVLGELYAQEQVLEGGKKRVEMYLYRGSAPCSAWPPTNPRPQHHVVHVVGRRVGQGGREQRRVL